MTPLPCPICKQLSLFYSYHAADYITHDTFEIFQCRNCTVGATKPELTPEVLSRYYAKQYYGSRKGVAASVINYLWMKKMSSIRKGAPGRLLDIGCGNGSFLQVAAERGWDIYGTEFAPDAHIAKEILPKIFRTDIYNCAFEKEFFAVITLWHSLEHVQNPEKYLEEIFRILQPGGLLVIEVPNFSSWQAKSFKANWLHLDVPRHVFHFSPASMRTLLTQSGFVVEKVAFGNAIYDLFGLLQSTLNTVTQEKNILFDALNGKTKQRTIPSFDIACIVLFLIPAVVVSFAIWLGEVVWQRNGTITVYATRQ